MCWSVSVMQILFIKENYDLTHLLWLMDHPVLVLISGGQHELKPRAGTATDDDDEQTSRSQA